MNACIPKWPSICGLAGGVSHSTRLVLTFLLLRRSREGEGGEGGEWAVVLAAVFSL